MTVSVVYCFDKTYARYAVVSCHSAWRNASSPLIFHWIFPAEIGRLVRRMCRKLRAVGIEIMLHPVSGRPFSEWSYHGYYSAAVYLRLLIPLYVEESRAIYVDADTVVTCDLSVLDKIDMHGKLLGGVSDACAAATTSMKFTTNDIYINTGVMLMDLDAIRSDCFEKKLVAIQATHGAQATYVDQCLLNRYAEGRKHLLSPIWNNMIFCNRNSPDQAIELLKSGCGTLFHFVGPMKPWHMNSNEIFARFWLHHAVKIMPVWVFFVRSQRLLNIFRPLMRLLLRRR